MRIVALDLQNTKSYETAHIEFTDGVNAIVGHNGAGKSTVLEAIGFTLFDCLTGYKQSDFVREGAKTAEITVTIVSSVDERSYQVIRRCGSSNLHAVHDPELGTKVCEGKADVLHFLRQQMGVDPATDLARLFNDAVGVPQGTFTAAFLQTPSQRKPIFDPLLKVEEYKQAFDKLLGPLRTLEAQQHELDVEMAGYAGRLERLPTLEEAVAERTTTIANQQAKVATLAAELASTITERNALEAIKQEVVTLRTQLQQCEQQQQNIDHQLQSAQQLHAEAERAANTVTTHQANYDEHLAAQAMQKQLETRSRTRQQLERQQAELDKRLTLNQATVERLAEQLAEVSAAEQELEKLHAAVASQQEIEASLQEAQQQSSRLQAVQAQLTTLTTRKESLQNRLTTLEQQLAQAATLETERTTTEATLEELQSKLGESRDTLARFTAEADALKEQSAALDNVATAHCPVCEQPLSAADRQRLQQRNETRLTELRDRYRSQQQAIKATEAEGKRLQDSLKLAQEQLRKLPRQAERTTLQEELALADETLAEQQAQVDQLVVAPAKVTEITAQLAALGDPRQQQAVAAATAKRRPQIEAEQTKAEQEIATANAKVGEVKQALADFATLETELEAVAQQLQRTLDGYQTVLRHQQVADSLPARIEAVTELTAEAATAATARQAAERAVNAAATRFDEERYRALVTAEETGRQQQQVERTELALLQREQEREQAEISQLKEQECVLATLRQQQQRVMQQHETLDALRNLLRQAGPHITKALIKQISDGAAQVFSDIMQDYSRQLRWTEDYGITLEIDGRERQFAQLSGGEQMSAALSVRLALLREMSSIDVAFFDEPTTNLDEERRDALARQIIDVKGFRQLFLISHDDTFEQATQNLIRVARVNGTSTILHS